MADAWLSGDLKQNGISQTLLSIAVSTTIGLCTSSVSNFISNKIQINKLSNDANINKRLMKKLGISYSFNKNGRSVNFFADTIKRNDWTSKLITDYLSSNISSNITGLLIGLF